MVDLSLKPYYLTPEQIEKVRKVIGAMTIDEKVGQLFCLVIYDYESSALDDIFSQLQPGGFMIRPMEGRQEVTAIKRLQDHAKIPLLISANLESGANGLITEGTKIGSEMQVAATDDPLYGAHLGQTVREEGTAFKANWAFSPIVDLDLNFRNPITNTRTFGSDPKKVAQFSVNFIENVQADGNMAACFKHFPGDGVDERDQHLVTSVNSLSEEEWENTYGYVYRKCIEAGSLTCMVGHIIQPALIHKFNNQIAPEDMLPASLSYELTTKLLREELGFYGLVVSDATTMAGISSSLPREDLVPQVIVAGCDMFLFTRNLQEDFSYMKQGVLSGVITAQRLDDALMRIIGLKVKLGLFEKKTELHTTYKKAMSSANFAAHQPWADEVADKSIVLVKEEKGVLPLKKSKKRILLYPLESQQGFSYGVTKGQIERFAEMLTKEGFDITFFNDKIGNEGRFISQAYYKAHYDYIIYVANMATRSNQTTVRIEWDMPMGVNVPTMYKVIPTIFISLENPYHLLDVPRIRTFINTFSSSEVTLKALVDKLVGRSSFKGVSPSDPFCGKWDTRL